MSEIIDRIVEVAKFADVKSDMNSGFTVVQFQPGLVRACNYSGGASAAVDLDIKAEVPAARLLKVCKALPEAEVSLQQEDGKPAQLCFQQGESRASLNLMPKGSGVKMSKPAKKAVWHEVNGLDQLDRVVWSAAKDDTRRHLMGVHLGKYGMACTNGHSCTVLSTPGDLTKELGKEGILVPPDMLKGLPEVTQISKDGERLFIAEDPSAGDYRVANLISTQFPPLDQVMTPIWKMPQMSIPRQPLENMLKRAKLADKDLVLSVEGKRLRVVVDGKRDGGALSLFDFEGSVPFEGGVPEGYIGFSNSYVLGAVQACVSDNITVHLLPARKGSVEPMGIVDGSFKAAIMPIRVS